MKYTKTIQKVGALCCLGFIFSPTLFTLFALTQSACWQEKIPTNSSTRKKQVFSDSNYKDLPEIKTIIQPNFSLSPPKPPEPSQKSVSVRKQKKLHVFSKKQQQEFTQTALYLIKKYEGFYSRRYRCPGGVTTIGYGLTQDGILTCQKYGYLLKYKLPTKITQSEAERILVEAVIPSHAKMIEKYVAVKLTPKQKAVLVSFAYNCGEEALSRVVSGPGRLNNGNYKSVEQIIPLYRKAGGKILKGLIKRRLEEVNIWKS